MEDFSFLVHRELANKLKYEKEYKRLIHKENIEDDPEVTLRIYTLEIKLEHISLWLSLLDVYELYVTTEHLIYGQTWSRVTSGYRRNWGGDGGEGSIERYQDRAIAKICKHLEDNPAYMHEVMYL